MGVKEAMSIFLKEPNKQNEKELVAELKKATFLAPIMLSTPLAKPDGSVIYEEEGSNIKFIILEGEDNDGNGYYPAFTSKNEMMKWRKDNEQEVLELKLKDYANMLLDEKNKFSGVVIDAFSHSLILDIKFIKAVFGNIVNRYRK